MNILLLGKNGMLGSELNRAFANDNLTSFDRPDIDFVKTKAVVERIKKDKPDVVINAVAYTDVDGCEDNADHALQVNANAVGEIAVITKRVGGIIVHFSTDYVFDGTNSEGYREDAKTNPKSLYGRSKLLGEEKLTRETDAYYLIRTSSLYGRQGNNFVKTILEKAKAGDELTIVDDQITKPTYARDLAQQVRNILVGGKDFGIYHITNEPPVSWYDFALAIVETAKLKTKIVPMKFADLKRPAPRPQYSILLNTKLKPLRSWKSTLPELIGELNES